MYYIISDIHGHYGEFEQRLRQISNIHKNKDKTSKLILLGDYIDRGIDSYKVLKKIYDLQMQYGRKRIIVLRGNHEEWFLDYLFHNEDYWLVEDENLKTSKTFLEEKHLVCLNKIVTSGHVLKIYDYIREEIKNNHKNLLNWMKCLPYYYKTEHQIFVHAGIDEEAEDWWEVGTPDYYFVGKYPPATGRFYMDIIAGHTSTSSISGDINYNDVYYDGKSHYYIDGSVTCSKFIPVLVYDEVNNKYYRLSKDGVIIALANSN